VIALRPHWGSVQRHEIRYQASTFQSHGAETKQTYVYEFMTVRNRRNWGWSVPGPARLQSMLIGFRSRTPSCPRRRAALLAQYLALIVPVAAAVELLAFWKWNAAEQLTILSLTASRILCILPAERSQSELGLTVTEMCSRLTPVIAENRHDGAGAFGQVPRCAVTCWCYMVAANVMTVKQYDVIGIFQSKWGLFAFFLYS